MNANRRCPGVPNRYTTVEASNVTRPKSNATVVVDLPSTPPRSSTPTLSEVITSSVCNDSTSLNAETSVVLPAPKPPATTIFNVSGTGLCPAGSTDPPNTATSQLPNAFQDHTQRLRVRTLPLPTRGVHHHLPPVQQVSQQNP